MFDIDGYTPIYTSSVIPKYLIAIFATTTDKYLTDCQSVRPLLCSNDTYFASQNPVNKGIGNTIRKAAISDEIVANGSTRSC